MACRSESKEVVPTLWAKRGKWFQPCCRRSMALGLTYIQIGGTSLKCTQNPSPQHHVSNLPGLQYSRSSGLSINGLLPVVYRQPAYSGMRLCGAQSACLDPRGVTRPGHHMPTTVLALAATAARRAARGIPYFEYRACLCVQNSFASRRGAPVLMHDSHHIRWKVLSTRAIPQAASRKVPSSKIASSAS